MIGLYDCVTSCYTPGYIHSSNKHVVSDLHNISVWNFCLDIDGEDGSKEFFLKLSYLRGHAEVYLSMLNDMRRRLKELPSDAPTAQQYRYHECGINFGHETVLSYE